MNTTGVLTRAETFELEGRGVLTLRPTDHIATGGEGSVYKPSSDLIIKLYSDSKKMSMDGMAIKLGLLKKINHPFIVAPKGLVFKNQNPIGYYMNYEQGEALARVFTTAYRNRENFTDKDVLSLVDGMRTVINVAHNNKAILVDANELNWLVSRKKKLAEPRVIDVDSWSIDHFKPSVIMPSIHDLHTNGFNESSDWFSFAVVSFQVFTGIHPYKGVLDGYKPNDILERMKDNKSVFTQGVRLNSAVRDFNAIPASLFAWYESVFQKGNRSLPPSPYDTSITAAKAAIIHRTVIITSSGKLNMSVLFDGVNDIPVQVYTCGVVRLRSGKMINLANGRMFDKSFSNHSEVIHTEYGFLVGEINSDGKLVFILVSKDGRSEIIETILHSNKIVRYYNRLFIITDQGLTEVTAKQFAKPIIVTKNTWQVLVNSTKWFDGIGVQDTMGTTYLITPFNEGACQYVHVPELDKSKVIEGIAGARCATLSVLENRTGQYKKYEIVFSKDYTSYQINISDIASPELNMTSLPKGVNAEIENDGSLLITVPTSGGRNDVTDAKINANFTLAHFENRVVAIEGSKVWAISLNP
ncbi:MAG: hypothetical protein NT068_00620 [Candidatus Nomurabacteria bacterium]|nr:hypothetical protein [Candidatus Nomurabacteria bacterium]